MPPHPPDETAPRSRPRHAADADARTFSSGALAEFSSALAEPSSGRHRRPESLADRTQLRPAPAVPSQNRRSAEERFELGEFEDSFIERGFPEPTRAERRRLLGWLTGEHPQVRDDQTGENPRVRPEHPDETTRIRGSHTGEQPLARGSHTGEQPLTRGSHTGEMAQVRAGNTGELPQTRGGRRGEAARGRHTGELPQVRGSHTGETPQVHSNHTGETPRARGRHTGELPQVRGGQTGDTARVDEGRVAEELYAEARRAAEARRVETGSSAEQRWSLRRQARRRAEERRAERRAAEARGDRVPVHGPDRDAEPWDAETREGNREAETREAGTASRLDVSPRLPGSSGRGKHAAPARPVVTVRQLPAVRDVVVDGLPAAKRAADAVREWALYTGDSPPVSGTHRAPGTLPIESWLLIGRGRQQALLASLVAVGLALVMIPLQRHESVNPVNAANRSIVDAASGQKANTRSPNKPARQNPNGTPGKPAVQPVPGQTSAPKTVPTVPGSADVEPSMAVPPGTGPAQSLRVTGSKTVALTFDDGPDPVQTPKILALLDKYQVKATFCLVGSQVKKHPEIVRQIVAAGHTLCNHTWNHSLTIGKAKPAQIRADLEKTNAAIRAAVPGAEIPFFRAPGGNFTDRLVSVAYGERMTSLYWQIDPRDWDHSTDADDATHTGRVIGAVQKDVKPGSIILSHDFGQPDTIEAYETLLPWLTERFEIGLPVPPPVPGEPASPPPSVSAPDSQPPASEGLSATPAEPQ